MTNRLEKAKEDLRKSLQNLEQTINSLTFSAAISNLKAAPGSGAVRQRAAESNASAKEQDLSSQQMSIMEDKKPATNNIVELNLKDLKNLMEG